MKCKLTKHAKKALAERAISVEWLERTLNTPELTLPDPDDVEVEPRFRKIPEFGGREGKTSWSAVAERERRHRLRADEAQGEFHPCRAGESGVALRFPPQSKTRSRGW